MKIDWNKLEVKDYNSLELSDIRRRSYYRYPGPNEYMLWMMLAIILLFCSFLFFSIHMHWFGLDIGEFPKYHKTNFWISEITMFLVGIGCIFMFFKRGKISKRRWQEMESIREKIDCELRSR